MIWQISEGVTNSLLRFIGSTTRILRIIKRIQKNVGDDEDEAFKTNMKKKNGKSALQELKEINNSILRPKY